MDFKTKKLQGTNTNWKVWDISQACTSIFSSFRIVNNWNSLPSEVVDAVYLRAFKSRLELIHLARQEVSSLSFAHPCSDLCVES